MFWLIYRPGPLGCLFCSVVHPVAAVEVLMAVDAGAQWGTPENMWVSGSCRSTTGEKRRCVSRLRGACPGEEVVNTREITQIHCVTEKVDWGWLVDLILALGWPLTSHATSLGLSLQNEGFELVPNL